MAALDFPASPAVGDKYPVAAVVGQPQYTWDGTKWTTVGPQVTNASPATALPLMDAATAVVGTATKYAREDHVHPKVPAAPLDALAYNGMQINGSMEVSQEFGTGGTGVPNQFPLDGWRYSAAGSMNISTAQLFHATLFPGFKNCLLYTVSIAQPSLGAMDQVSAQHTLEGNRTVRLAWGGASAKPLTISFWSCHSFVGTYSVVVRNFDASRSCAMAYTQNVSNAQEYKTVTFPGCTDGTWNTDNTAGLVIFFTFAAGASRIAPAAGVWNAASYLAAPGQVNFANTAGNAIRMTGVTILPGTEAPSAERSPLIMRPYDQELLTCQRYYEKLAGTIGSGVVFDTASVRIAIRYVTKRAVPTLANSALGQLAIYSAGTTIAINAFGGSVAAGLDGMMGAYGVAGGLTVAHAAVLFNNGSGYVTLDARL